MSPFVPVIGVLFAAAITPGPNNMIVMQAGARDGIAAAVAALLGVVAGSLVLLSLVWWGVGGVMQAYPILELALSIGGAAYLAWIGIALILRARGNQPEAAYDGLPSTVLGVAAFQLLNPKAWVLVTTAAAAMPRMDGVFTLALLMTVVTTACLTAWALLGAASARLLARSHARLWFDRVMGGLLAISALGIVIDALEP
jgi:threonine/homoserine/homoserine lactone efflux protein